MKSLGDDHPDLEVHHRVIRPAHLGASADERAGLGDLGDLEDVVGVVGLRIGHDVALEQEFRHPERVHHVGGRDLELNALAGGQHQNGNLGGAAQRLDLVEVQVAPVLGVEAADRADEFLAALVDSLRLGLHRRFALVVGAVVGEGAVGEVDLLVAELPVPLERGHVDHDLGVGVLVQHLLLHHHGEIEQHRDDQERRDGEHQFQRHVVAELARQLGVALLVPVKRRRPEDEAPHDHTDNERGDQRTDPQFAIEVRLRRDALRPAKPGHFRPAAPAE